MQTTTSTYQNRGNFYLSSTNSVLNACRSYELANHLGNVLSVISDKVIPHQNGTTVDYFLADIRQSTDYSPFGVTLQGRNFTASGADGFRYGFQGQEMDDEIKGKGNSVNYEYRMHDPRLGRFFAIDPMIKQYAYFSSYSFSGNVVINSIEIEGLEPGVIVGSSRQVEIVNQFNTNVSKQEQNWTVFQFLSIESATSKLKQHKASGNELKVLFIQAHGSYGAVNVLAGIDGVVDTRGLNLDDPNENFTNDDGSINYYQIQNFYIPTLSKINSIKNKKEKSIAMKEFKENQNVKDIESFIEMLQQVDEGGTVILNACHVFGTTEGEQLLDGLKQLTGKNINFIGPSDFTSDIYYDGEEAKLFGEGLIPASKFSNGFNFNNTSSGSNLKLNGTGADLFELIPQAK